MLEAVIRTLMLCLACCVEVGDSVGRGETSQRARRTREEVRQLRAQAEADAKADAKASVYEAVVVLLGVEAILGCLLLLDGFGPPDTGHDFFDCGDVFDDVSTILKGANPDFGEGWNGDAAAAYAKLNQELRIQVESMAEADRDAGDTLKGRAPHVLNLRIIIGELAAATGGAIAVAYALYRKYEVALAAGYWSVAEAWATLLKNFSRIVAVAILSAAIAEIFKLNAVAGEGSFWSRAGDYQRVVYAIESMLPRGAALTAVPVAAPQSSVSDFSGVAEWFTDKAGQSDAIGAASDSRENVPAGTHASMFSNAVAPSLSWVNHAGQQLTIQTRRPARSQQTSFVDPANVDYDGTPAAEVTAGGPEGWETAPGASQTLGIPSDLAAMADAAQPHERRLAQLMGFG